MNWTDLLFLHWRVPPDAIAPSLPEGVELDTYDGDAWIALVPFRMTDCAFAGFGWAPGLQDFYECNVRTYARVGDRAGVWFFSLDAANLLPVIGGRLIWNLNYVHSRFSVTASDGARDYRLRRRRGPWPGGSTHVRWTFGQRAPAATLGSLEHFLTERYWLFTRRRGRLFAGRIHHDPWSLTHATVDHIDDTLVAAAGVDLAGRPPDSVLGSRRLEVTGEPLRAVDDPRRGGAA